MVRTSWLSTAGPRGSAATAPPATGPTPRRPPTCSRPTRPTLCLSCHNGSGATTDVADGIQYVPNGNGTSPGTGGQVLGALRGGGFNFALIDTSNASRETYSRAGGVLVTLSAVPASGNSVTLTWPAVADASFAGGSISFDPTATAATVQTAATTLFGNSTVYSGSTAAGNMSGLPAGNANVVVTKAADSKSFTFTWHNAFRAVRVPLPTVSANTSGVTVTPSDTTTVSATAHVGVLADGAATTSSHEGAGTVWGNGAVNSGAGASVTLDCAKCHNPHGNGQYRILQTTPGEDWTTASVAGWTAASQDVEVQDVGLTTSVKNYTVLPGLQASDVVAYGPTAGDYFRRKYDPSGAANWTNFYLKGDPMNAGWNGASATNEASITIKTTLSAAVTSASSTSISVASASGFPGSGTYYVTIDGETMLVTAGAGTTTWTVTRGQNSTATTHASGATVYSSLLNSTGLMTAWCITCHTRYSGLTVAGSPSSLTDNSGGDTTFMFKHGTTSIGCEQCHVSHGTNAAMDAASSVNWPGQALTTSSPDSRLLKVDNRGTCNLCHDPTGTVDPGVFTGSHPATITPGP